MALVFIPCHPTCVLTVSQICAGLCEVVSKEMEDIDKLGHRVNRLHAALDEMVKIGSSASP